MDVRILGPFEVVGDAGPVALPRGRGRSLLALLALRVGDLLSAERLIDELWGGVPPPTAHKGLHNLISDLRRRLASVAADGRAESVIVTSGAGYRLQIDRDEVDANRFRSLLQEASGAPAEERAARLRAALELWRGPVLADFEYESFAQADIAVLEELRLTALEERIDADVDLGRHTELVGELVGLTSEHPFRERFRAQLMLALYRCGRRHDALQAYEHGRRVLAEELGLDPGAELTDLARAIVDRDAALAPSATPAAFGGAAKPRTEAEPESWMGAERKTVTIVCIELTESTTSADDVDPEPLRTLQRRGVEAAATILGRHGAAVEGIIGGVMVASFTAHEDAALRAARAALELQEALAAIGPELGPDRRPRLAARIGINTGEVVVGDAAGGPSAASGHTVQLAARLQQAAGEGDVLVGEATRQLLGRGAMVESAAALVLDRRGRPATAWRLVGLPPGEADRSPERTGPFVGRESDISRLHAAFQRTLRQGRASRFTVIGQAGVGKSRLGMEFVDGLADDAVAFSCRCPAYGDGITFWPLRELVLRATGGLAPEGIASLLGGDGDAASVAAQVAGAIGLHDEPGAGADLFPSVRRLVLAVTRTRPVVIVVDDAHWAQTTFLDLLDYLVESVEAPVLILCLGRPDLGETRPDLVRDPTASMVLEPLQPAQSERLVVDRLAGRLVPDDVVTQIVDMADGNPLFIEQLLASLRDHGKLRFPPSVHALLSARLDRLGPAERDLLRCASVIGTEFSLEALAALVPDRALPFIRRHLLALERKELLHRKRRSSHGGASFAFRHVLIQQAAYRATTLEDRAQIHQRLARWLDRSPSPEMEEVIAHHLEQAHEHRRHLGIDDGATLDLALRAGERLAEAGLRAYRRFDMTAAENLLSRSRKLLPTDHPKRYAVLRRLAEAYPTLGRLEEGERVLTEMLDDPHVRQDARLERRLELERLRIQLIAGPDPVRHDTIRSHVNRAMAVLEKLGDDVGMSQACYLLATMLLRSGRVRELEQVGARGLEHARRSGDLRELLGALWWPAWALVAGETPVPDAMTACEELLRVGRGRHIGVMTDLARLRAMLGEFDSARELTFRARREVQERIRVRRALTVVAHRTADVEALAGDLEAAERALRRGMEIALDVGERDQTAQIAADLSRILAARGALQEAATFASISRRQAPAESVAAQALWRVATARALALEGDTADALGLARDAIARVPVELLDLRAQLHVDMANVLRVAGQQGASSVAAHEAAVLYDRKGNLVGAARTRRLSEHPPAAPP